MRVPYPIRFNQRFVPRHHLLRSRFRAGCSLHAAILFAVDSPFLPHGRIAVLVIITACCNRLDYRNATLDYLRRAHTAFLGLATCRMVLVDRRVDSDSPTPAHVYLPRSSYAVVNAGAAVCQRTVLPTLPSVG